MRTPNLEKDVVLTVAEVASLLKLSRQQIYISIREGNIPFIKFGGKMLVPAKYVVDLVSSARYMEKSDDVEKAGHEE